MEFHNIDPIFDKNSRVLILGSFPSQKSREQQFFYAHPQNRFWRVLAAVFSTEAPQTVKEKTEFLLSNNIALWDVIQSCDIIGSSDSSIKNVCVNDIERLLSQSKIEKIYVNGKTAEKYYNKYIYPKLQIKAFCLPSTSAANAAMSFEKLRKAYTVIL